MANLRLIATKVVDSTTIKARFTESLDSLINTANIEITAITPGIPDPKVLAVRISNDILVITVRPLTPYGAFFLKFQSTDSFKFKSKKGNFLLEDGKTNVPLILGPEDPADPVRDLLTGYLKDNIYNIDSGTLVRDIINSQATNLSQALHDIGQLKNDNYLTVLVENEVKTRGAGPYDRLNEEGAYQIVRVGKKPAGSTVDTSQNFSEFPSGPITLLSVAITNEKLTAGAGSKTFDGLILTVDNRFVTKLTSVRIAYQNGSSVTYDISVYGYQLAEPRYDQDFASPLFTLEDNQFKLSDLILDTSFVLPGSGDFVFVSYEYQNKGRVVDADNVIVSQVLDATREVTPPIQTEFSLANAPVVTVNDITATSDGVVFLDPSSNPPFSETHPAFLRELPFKFDGLPRQPGEYSIDYATGRVFSFGAEENDGTGDYPPTATYKYRKTFASRLDYTYDPDLQEVVANPSRELIGEIAKISFSYEEVLVPGVDYVPQIHAEVLDERIENRLTATNALTTLQAPVTNVFRIYNETSGEVYKIVRWNNNKVYFTFNTPPRILEQKKERASFTNVFNETLLLNNEFTNGLGTRVFVLLLSNNRIISASEDVIGSSFNSSATFSRTDIFINELYYDGQLLTETENTNRLIVGTYQINYDDGIVYVGVDGAQNLDVGTINYKKSTISPENSHLVSVSEIYHSINALGTISKKLNYINFDEGEIQPSTFDRADERFLNGDETLSYTVSAGTITVTDDIKDVRNVFDVYDLNNNIEPTNFSSGATVSANTITLDAEGVEKQETLTVQAGNVLTATFITAGAEIVEVVSAVRTSDGIDLWATPGTFSGYTITLSGSGSPLPGDEVFVTYRVALNGMATPIVDYNRGEYFIDYTFLADEILVSYEHGDNNLDFRESDSLNEGEQYFATYKVGALRDALLKNFGSLVNLPILRSLDTTLPRENYRDALRGALKSFPRGPTIPSMKAVVSHITHIDPELEEAAFQNWSLGLSHLYLSDITTTGTLQLLSGKYDFGALMTEPDQTISFPVASNLRLEEGTLETWVIPEWDGLDNDATLTFSLRLNGSVLSANKVWVGADSHHPTYDDENKFEVNKTDTSSPIGLPSAIFTQTGMFVYYDDVAKQWKVYAKDVIADGYSYSGTIESSGEFYDVKFLPGLGEINDVLRSGTRKVEFEFNLDSNDLSSPDGYSDGYTAEDGYFPADGYQAGYSFDGIRFMADDEHYLFDFGKTDSANRFSLYKDGSGFLNFRVYDRGGKRRANQYKISTDISSWSAGQKYHVAVTWRLSSSDRRDEMHLFIDGVEVPNILRYGGRPIGTSTDRFRIVKPEIVAGTVPKKAIAGNDLTTTLDSTFVESETNFQAEGIVAGDSIDIDELNFGSYTIISVSGNSLILSSPMPASLSDARFSVNKYSVIVSSEIDLFNNIAVSVLSGTTETEIPGVRADIPSYSISKNSLNQNVLTILGSADVGDQILIRTLGLNHRRCRDTKFVWGNSTSILKTQLPPPINLDEAKITALLLPITPVGPSNSVFSLGTFTATLSPTQPSNEDEGRTLSVRITSGNVSFSPSPVSVTINGTTAAGPVFETLIFTAAGTQSTTNKFKTITSAVVVATPILSTKNSVSVEIKETYPLTTSEGNNTYPVIRFSYKTQTGLTLSGDGSDTVTDTNGFFTESNIGQKLVINTPPAVAGTYTIVTRVDDTTLTVSPTPSVSFSNGTYDIFNTTLGRSGFQNGFFVLEQAGTTNVPFELKEGWYEFDFSAYLEIPFDPMGNIKGYVGSDLHGDHQAKAVLDELRILSKRLSDVRVGETLALGENSITTDSTALRAFEPDSDTLVLLHFDSLPIKNSADFWIRADKEYIQSDSGVNSNFGSSLVVVDRPYVVDNTGFLTTTSEGSIEFWVSPRYDTYNDPEERFYFDAAGAIVEEVLSTTNGTVKVDGRISSVISVRLVTDTTATGTEYFGGGTIESDFQTIRLQKALPSQQTKVKVNYIPSGLSGDRISIYKDREGFITFNVRADGTDYQTRQPVFWQRDTWHRVQATYKFNRADNQDEIRLFIDGEERGVILFGSGLLFGEGVVFGQGTVGVDDTILISDINFSDPINEFFIGSDYLRTHVGAARIDNLRLSNIARRTTLVSGQPKDVNYSSNLSIVYPVIPDAFTTFLFDFDSLLKKADDFALLRDERFGIFDFTLNIIDSFGIVSSNAKVKQVLETLIGALKPANSRVTINYIS